MSLLACLTSPARAARLGHLTHRYGAAQIATAVEQRRARGFAPNLLPIQSNDALKVTALNQTGFKTTPVALEHILEVADAGTLLDGAPSGPAAAALFDLAGRSVPVAHGNCYGRTLHAILSTHHSGELSRIMADLLLRGRTTLASGQQVRWDPATLPVDVRFHQYHDALLGTLANDLRFTHQPDPLILHLAPGYASRGQMANVSTHYFGTQFVNAPGQPLLPHLRDILPRTGPLLAEYPASSHGGSIARVDRDAVRSLETGGHLATLPKHNLGYVVVPESEVAALPSVQPIDLSSVHDGTEYFRLRS